MKWISIKDCIPEPGVDVLIFHNNNLADQVFVARRDFDADWKNEFSVFLPNNGDSIEVPIDEVTHWMPLPENPE